MSLFLIHFFACVHFIIDDLLLGRISLFKYCCAVSQKLCEKYISFLQQFHTLIQIIVRNHTFLSWGNVIFRQLVMPSQSKFVVITLVYCCCS